MAFTYCNLTIKINVDIWQRGLRVLFATAHCRTRNHATKCQLFSALCVTCKFKYQLYNLFMKKYKDKIAYIHKSLGISNLYSNEFGLTLQYEETDLVDIGIDVFGRPQRLGVLASEAWKLMHINAKDENVILNVVSAFRSVEKQIEIIKRKVEDGQSLVNILKVSAAPGYSEHHTGRALDITTEGSEPLSESFENTEAFQWLQENAHLHHFRLSYPKDNKFGIAYEPWHWAYVGV